MSAQGQQRDRSEWGNSDQEEEEDEHEDYESAQVERASRQKWRACQEEYHRHHVDGGSSETGREELP
jgi:hypothetical protein